MQHSRKVGDRIDKRGLTKGSSVSNEGGTVKTPMEVDTQDGANNKRNS